MQNKGSGRLAHWNAQEQLNSVTRKIWFTPIWNCMKRECMFLWASPSESVTQRKVSPVLPGKWQTHFQWVWVRFPCVTSPEQGSSCMCVHLLPWARTTTQGCGNVSGGKGERKTPEWFLSSKANPMSSRREGSSGLPRAVLALPYKTLQTQWPEGRIRK